MNKAEAKATTITIPMKGRYFLHKKVKCIF